MRYDDWDIILFPTGRDSKIPFKEFKVACNVVPDLELSHVHGPVGIPVMTCFVPSLLAGTAFQVSIHSWRKPDISQFTRTYSKNAEQVKFEARVMLDGRVAASTVLDREVNGPHLVTSSFDFTKTGELERLKFPHFRHELLQQNHWHPGDDLGRIKIIISEGFPRDLIAAPVERVKNVVVFSFQHAPLEMLENNGIAWPNPSMWRRQALNPTLPVPTYHPDNGAESHTHSPGRRSLLVRNIPNQCFPGATVDSNLFQSQAGAGAIGPLGTQSWQMPYLGRSNTGSGNALSHADSFSESAYREWVSSMTSGHPTGMDIWDGRASWQMNPRNSAKHPSDAIMSDYISPQTSDPMQISGGSLEDDPMSLKVPTNTPTGEARDDPQNPQFQQTAALNCDFASSLTQSLLNQPFPLPMPQHQLSFPSSELYYRKENRHGSLAHANAALLQPASLSGGTETRKLSQSVFGIGGLETSTPVPTDGSEEMTSITLQHMFATSSRNPLADFGSSMMNSTGSTVGTPMGVTGVVDQADSTPVSNVKSLAAPTSGGGSSTSGNTAVKRTRNFTPASAKAIDEEDEPRRLSPHVRIAGFCGVDISSDSVH